MNIKEYQTIINKTAIYPKEYGSAYTALGLMGELGELQIALFTGDKKDVLKESGDCYWYITATCNEHNIDLSEVFIEDAHLTSTAFDISMFDAILTGTEVCEIIKKYVRDQKIDLDRLTNKLKTIFIGINEAHANLGIIFEEVLEANYNKLIKRRETGTLQGSGDNREETQG